jgi:hypothetical protein
MIPEEDEPLSPWVHLLVFVAGVAIIGGFWMAVAAYFAGEL